MEMRSSHYLAAAELSEDELVDIVKSGNDPFINNLRSQHIAAKFCFPKALLWSTFTETDTFLHCEGTKTPLQLANENGHIYIANLLGQPANSTYLHSIILWMIKNARPAYESTLQKHFSRIFSNETQASVITNHVLSKAGSMQYIASHMIATPMNHANALKGFYHVFIDQIDKNYFTAVDALGSLLFLFLSKKNIDEVQAILLREKNFNLLTLWMIGHDIHPYQVISSLRNTELQMELINHFWSIKGIMQYVLRRLLLNKWDKNDEHLFLILPKSDKSVFDTLLNCIIDINKNGELALIIGQLQSNPNTSIPQRVAQIKDFTSHAQNYFNHLFKQTGLTVRLGENVARVALDDCAIMHMLGFKKRPAESKDQPAEFEEQPTLEPMLNLEGLTVLSLVNRNYYHIVTRSPKDPTILKEIISIIEKHIIDTQIEIDQLIRLIAKINSIINTINQEINSKGYFSNRSWPWWYLLADVLSLIPMGLSLYGELYAFKLYSTSMNELKTTVPHYESCYELFVRGDNHCNDEWYYYEKCRNGCEGLEVARDVGIAGAIGIGASAAAIIAALVCTGIKFYRQTFRAGPERFQTAPIKGYSRQLQTEVKEVSPENYSPNEAINQVSARMTTELTRLTQIQQGLQEEKRLLPAMHSLFLNRYRLFRPQSPAQSAETKPLAEADTSQLDIVIDDVVRSSERSMARKYFKLKTTDDLRTPLLGR